LEMKMERFTEIKLIKSYKKIGKLSSQNLQNQITLSFSLLLSQMSISSMS